MPSLAQPTDAFWGSSTDRELDVGETPGDGGCRHRLRCDRDDGRGHRRHPDAAINSVAEIIRAGAVGVNLEDGTPRGAAPIRNIADTADRIRAAREAARAVGVTDRHQHLHRSLLAQHRRRSGALRRERGAPEGMPGRRRGLILSDRFARPPTIARLMKAPAAPTNIMIRAGLPIVAELEALGVARAGTASAVSLLAMATTSQIAEELRKTGSFDTLAPAMTQADAQRLFATP